MLTKQKWYSAGLRFECTQCGNCCSGPPGYVWVTKKEIARIAAFLDREDHRSDKKHLRREGFRHSLTEKPDGDCVFLKRQDGQALCSIYPVRPHQCRTWPFWKANLKTPDAWNQAHRTTCPGMNQGKHYTLVQIEQIRDSKPQ